MDWKAKLTESRKLKAKGAALSYDRVVLYRDIYSDLTFRADCEDREVNPEDELDLECADLCCGVMVLLAVLREYPERKQWEANRLERMAAEVVEKRKADAGERTLRDRKSWKVMYEELLGQYRELERQHELTQARLEELEKVRGLATV